MSLRPAGGSVHLHPPKLNSLWRIPHDLLQIAIILHADKATAHKFSIALIHNIFAQLIEVHEVFYIFSNLIAGLMLRDVLSHVRAGFRSVHDNEIMKMVCQFSDLIRLKCFRIVRNIQ